MTTGTALKAKGHIFPICPPPAQAEMADARANHIEGPLLATSLRRPSVGAVEICRGYLSQALRKPPIPGFADKGRGKTNPPCSRAQLDRQLLKVHPGRCPPAALLQSPRSKSQTRHSKLCDRRYTDPEHISAAFKWKPCRGNTRPLGRQCSESWFVCQTS